MAFKIMKPLTTDVKSVSKGNKKTPKEVKDYTITITDSKVKRKSDSKILTIIIPDEELGYYKSLLELERKGYTDIYQYIAETSINSRPDLYDAIS